MPTYTYDDFLKATEKQGWGLGNGFSEADWKLAQENPDAGMSILQSKIDYNAATTEEERIRANQSAERTRSLYGGYTEGRSGNQYHLDDPSPRSFQMQEEKPTFSYNLETDPVYQAYQKQYLREGQRATQDTLGTAAASTGGLPSSYAMTAASQAGDYYAAQLSDKVPELYQQAYSRYLNDLNQWNTDRSFQYGQHLDEINSKNAARQEAMQNAVLGAQYGDYRGLKAQGNNVDNIPYEYQKRYTESADNWNRQYQLAVLMAERGDPSYLDRLVKGLFP